MPDINIPAHEIHTICGPRREKPNGETQAKLLSINGVTIDSFDCSSGLLTVTVNASSETWLEHIYFDIASSNQNHEAEDLTYVYYYATIRSQIDQNTTYNIYTPYYSQQSDVYISVWVTGVIGSKLNDLNNCP